MLARLIEAAGDERDQRPQVLDPPCIHTVHIAGRRKAGRSLVRTPGRHGNPGAQQSQAKLLLGRYRSDDRGGERALSGLGPVQLPFEIGAQQLKIRSQGVRGRSMVFVDERQDAEEIVDEMPAFDRRPEGDQHAAGAVRVPSLQLLPCDLDQMSAIQTESAQRFSGVRGIQARGRTLGFREEHRCDPLGRRRVIRKSAAT